MSANRDTLHLLLLTETQNDAESLVSLMRNSGSATRAHQITSLQDLNEQLQEKSWDMLIAQPKVGDIAYEDLMQLIRRLNKDLPVILIAEDVDPMIMEAAIKRGACTVVPQDESNLLVMVIQRELRHLRTRRELRTLEVRIREAEKRCQNLLENSRDAVAYIHDGMHVYANQAYLELFGYQSVEELEGMPIMDMVDGSAQQDFKAFLKAYQTDHLSNPELRTRGINGDGAAFPMLMAFSQATYADERCTQVLIRINADNSELEEKLREISSRDMMTGLYNKQHFIGNLEQAVDRAVLKGARGAVLYINIDHFGRIKSEVGISHADTVINEVASVLKKKANDQDVLARVGEDIFCCLRMGADAESALAFAEVIRDKVEHLLIDIGNRTVTATVSIGISLITENSSRPEDILQQSHHAADDVRKQEGHERGNGCYLYVPKDADEKKEAESLEKLLIDAIRGSSFRLMFQPMISLRGDEAEHYETLLRLKMPDGEELSAGEFLNSTEISDDVKRKIDRWVVLHTTKLLGEHRAKGHNTRMFINLSAASLADEALPGWIGVAMNAAKLPKGSVVFQFNEEDAGRMLKQAQVFSQALTERAIPCALSRFGCALNPMQTLKYMNVEYVKVDGSFTRDLGQNPDTQKHLKEMLEQLHEEDKKTIVPLVESATSVASLWQFGVHFIQGFYVQPPQASMTFDFHDDNDM
ncbi:EAL domain-containing protein [Thalassolituus sp. LLYu03]|uniref:EAL domain-containing response regulator n=1 Tax=Thalassolituus sp. LLYu03 TaxID=3421656 RepID=UPI003D2DEF75